MSLPEMYLIEVTQYGTWIAWLDANQRTTLSMPDAGLFTEQAARAYLSTHPGTAWPLSAINPKHMITIYMGNNLDTSKALKI